MSKTPKINTSIQIGPFSIEVEDILSYFGKTQMSGPFLIIERESGLALKTPPRAEMGWQPYLGRAFGSAEDMWFFKKKANGSEELIIISASCGMVLDNACDNEKEVSLILYKEHGGANQCWRMIQSSDSFGWIIQSSHDDKVLDVGRKPQKGQGLWLCDKNENLHQQFLILPIGKIK